MDKLKRNSSLTFLHRHVAEMLELSLAECKQQGLWVYPFETWRSFERQQDRYRQGRDPASPGAIVTNAAPGTSFHHYGLAVDLVFDADPGREGKQWTWTGDYPRVAAILQRHGFEWGRNFKSFKEDCHFQLTYGLTVEHALKLYDEGGIFGVWDHFDKLVLEYPRRFKDVV